MYKNMPPTVFSSSGRLLTVESMVAAASNPEDVSSNVVAALTFDEGVLVVSCRNQSPHLDVDNCTDTGSLLFPPSSNFQVGPQVYATTAGNAADSQILRDKVLQISFMLWERASGGLGTGAILPLPPSHLARHVADHLQRPTQQVSSGKILASQVLVWDASSIWRVDPSGQFWKCRVAAIGRSHHTVEAAFVEKYKENLSLNEAMLLAVEAIQRVVPKERTLFGIVVRNDKTTSPLTHDMLTCAGK